MTDHDDMIIDELAHKIAARVLRDRDKALSWRDAGYATPLAAAAVLVGEDGHDDEIRARAIAIVAEELAYDYDECAYCGAEIPVVMSDVPDLYDDPAWARVAKAHERCCEWVETRAHRLDPDKL